MVPKKLPDNAVWIIVDVQRPIDHPLWRTRNNPEMEKNLSKLLSVWRKTKRPVIQIKSLRMGASPYFVIWRAFLQLAAI